MIHWECEECNIVISEEELLEEQCCPVCRRTWSIFGYEDDPEEE